MIPLTASGHVFGISSRAPSMMRRSRSAFIRASLRVVLEERRNSCKHLTQKNLGTVSQDPKLIFHGTHRGAQTACFERRCHCTCATLRNPPARSSCVHSQAVSAVSVAPCREWQPLGQPRGSNSGILRSTPSHEVQRESSTWTASRQQPGHGEIVT